MESTITKQLEQNELIEQIVFIMSTKFKIDNKEASEFVFKKLYENTAVPAPTDAVKVSKETSKKSKKVADHIPEEAITAVVVKELLVKAPAKRSKKVAVVEAEVVVVSDETAKEVGLVKAPAKKSKKVAVVEAEVVVVSDEIAKEVVVKAPAKRSKKVATVQEDTAKESSGDETTKESKPSKRGKKVETLKTVELSKVTEELKEDDIDG